MFGRDTFIVRIAEDAMAPRACEGDYVWIDPDEPVADGRFVAVRDPARAALEPFPTNLPTWTDQRLRANRHHAERDAETEIQVSSINQGRPHRGHAARPRRGGAVRRDRRRGPRAIPPETLLQ